MASDSNTNALTPLASKDFGKKKRANRSAKLKQSKLDARREQWLSRAKNKGRKDDAREASGEFQAPGAEMRISVSPRLKELDVRRQSEEEEEVDGFVQHESDPESPDYSPSSGIGSSNIFTASSRSSISSFRSSRGSSSGGFSEEEVEGGADGDDGCVDDWEEVADALAAAEFHDKQPGDGGENPGAEKYMADKLENPCEMSHGNERNVIARAEKDRSDCAQIATSGAANNHAWKTDDVFRPQSLPNLSKQRTLPTNSEKLGRRGLIPWYCSGSASPPKSCPICCEDFDSTDLSFLPCSCGFRLCLFCHKRILEGDARCPGCRKPYKSSTTEKEASDSEGGRSRSML